MYPLSIVLYFICIAAIAQAPLDKEGRIYISKDRGVNWEKADTGFPEDATVHTWVVHDGMVLAGTNGHGIFISSDRLKTWYPSSKGLKKNSWIISMASFRNKLFVGTHNDGIFSSDDGGNSWHPSNTGLKNLSVRCLYAMGTILLAGTNDGIYSSTDNGRSWELEKKGLQINIFSSSHHQIFAATNQGVLASNDFGKTWDWIFKEHAIYTLAAHKDEVYIMIMDFNGTVFKTTRDNFIWLKADAYLPFHGTFQLTPVSSKFLTAPWKGVFKTLNDMNGGFFKANGLPENSAFTELLDTPFGILASSVLPKKNE